MDDFVRDMHTASRAARRAGRRASPWPRPRSRCWPTCASGCPSRARRRSAATPSPPTAASSPATCPSSRPTCTTGSSTCPRSRSCPAAGTRGPTSTPRRRPAGTARWPTSARPSPSCATTARRVFVPQPGPDSDTARAIAAKYVQRRHRRPSTRRLRSRVGRPGRLTRRAAPGRDPVHSVSAGRAAPGMVGVAQLVEHLVVVQVAAGSSPVTHPAWGGPGRPPTGVLLVCGSLWSRPAPSRRRPLPGATRSGAGAGAAVPVARGRRPADRAEALAGVVAARLRMVARGGALGAVGRPAHHCLLPLTHAAGRRPVHPGAGRSVSRRRDRAAPAGHPAGRASRRRGPR